jgi:hypothetical protein
MHFMCRAVLPRGSIDLPQLCQGGPSSRTAVPSADQWRRYTVWMHGMDQIHGVPCTVLILYA